MAAARRRRNRRVARNENNMLSLQRQSKGGENKEKQRIMKAWRIEAAAAAASIGRRIVAYQRNVASAAAYKRHAARA